MILTAAVGYHDAGIRDMPVEIRKDDGMNQSASHERGPSAEGAGESLNYRQRALATGLELSRNAVRAKTLDELQFVLVNDTRALLPFDRSLLIAHFSGKSSLVAANNQAKLDSKSEFVQRVGKLAPKLRAVERGLVLFARSLKADGLDPETAAELTEYIEYANCSCLIVVPLSVYDKIIGHLLLEFFGDTPPGEVETLTLLNMVPFFSSALAEKWMLEKEARFRKTYFGAISEEGAAKARSALYRKITILVVLVVLAVLAMCSPVTLKIGGKAEATPDYEFSAFVQMDGILDRVFAKEGDLVKKDQVVGLLDAKEIDFKIRESLRLMESYRAEIEILRNQSAENPAKLAESQLLAIKSLRAGQELDFLKWQRQFLDIRSPVDGVIVTKRVESLIGKKFKAGEVFCKIAPHDVLIMEILVRESDVGYLKEGQHGVVFFNYQPEHGYPLRVKSISPKAEAVEHVGSSFRVRADFLERPPDIRPGMQGIAHVDTNEVSLWFMLTRRIHMKISEILLAF